jgi:hypothetical protein
VEKKKGFVWRYRGTPSTAFGNHMLLESLEIVTLASRMRKFHRTTALVFSMACSPIAIETTLSSARGSVNSCTVQSINTDKEEEEEDDDDDELFFSSTLSPALRCTLKKLRCLLAPRRVVGSLSGLCSAPSPPPAHAFFSAAAGLLHATAHWLAGNFRSRRAEGRPASWKAKYHQSRQGHKLLR